MTYFRNADGKRIVDDVANAICACKAYLSDLDGALGDGDHGVNMSKGFALYRESAAEQPLNLSQALASVSETLMAKIGGAMGPLYGILLGAMSSAITDDENIDAEAFGAMLRAGEEGIRRISAARVGDKTLVDVLIPASDAYAEAVALRSSFQEALNAMRRAARRGRDSTKDLVAKVGRSSRLGERSRGVIDAGAASCCLILEVMAESILELLKLEESREDVGDY